MKIRRLRLVPISILASATIILSSNTVANAEESPLESVAQKVISAVEIADPDISSNAATGTSSVVPAALESGIAVKSADGTALTIGAPLETSTSDGKTASDGSTVYLGLGDSPDVVVQALDTGVRISTVIDSENQTSTFTYPLSNNVEASLGSNGVVTLTETDSLPTETGDAIEVSGIVGYIEPAWAIDSAGQAVKTHYEISDEGLRQIVELDDHVLFPVVADPQLTTLSVFQTRLRWNRAETKTIAAAGWGSTGLTAVCAAAGAAAGGPPLAAAFAAACFAISGSGVYTAGVAENSKPKTCLQLTLTRTFVSVTVIWFDTYSGGFCS